jgi:hypothetical protein
VGEVRTGGGEFAAPVPSAVFLTFTERCCGWKLQGMDADVSALKRTVICLPPSTGRMPLNFSSVAFWVVPPYPVAWQNILYRGTAAYDRPAMAITVAVAYKAATLLRSERVSARRRRGERGKGSERGG